jgi:hypothetical protein
MAAAGIVATFPVNCCVALIIVSTMFRQFFFRVHSSLVFEVSQILGVATGIKIHYSDPSLDKSIRIVRQIEQLFEPYCVMCKELKGAEAASITMCLQRKDKDYKILKLFFLGGGGGAVNYLRIFAGGGGGYFKKTPPKSVYFIWFKPIVILCWL